MKISNTHHRTKDGIVKHNPLKRIILYRNKSQEEHVSGGNVHLWFVDSKLDFIVSLVGQPKNVRLRISTPKGSREYALPFASTHFTTYDQDYFGDLKRFKEDVSRMIKRDFGYDVELR
jgi:hypothetical protein